jgi:hypothetical protein
MSIIIAFIITLGQLLAVVAGVAKLSKPTFDALVVYGSPPTLIIDFISNNL